MRVIAGQYRSRRLKSVPGTTVRPTPDRLREALFNVLSPRLGGTVFVDAYAGSGAVGIEALSRGAKQVILIERHLQALTVIRENLAALDIGNEVTVVRGSATASLKKYSAQLAFDIVFIDPPYEQTKEYTESLTILADIGCPFVIVQHASRFSLEAQYGELQRTRVLTQGDNSLSFYELRQSRER